MKLKKISICAVFTAFICVVAPFSLPIGPVPVSLAPFMVFMIAGILGYKEGTLVVALYVAIGALGLPVFSGFKGGAGVIAGPTGGFIIGFIAQAFIAGLFMKNLNKRIKCFSGMLLGLGVNYIMGTVWFMISMDASLPKALAACIYPFVLLDIIKIFAALYLSAEIRKRLEIKL